MGGVYRDSSIIVLALAFPIAIDIIVDIYATVSPKLTKRGKVTSGNEVTVCCLNLCEKLICFIGIVIVPITSMATADQLNKTLIFNCAKKCQIVIVGGIIMSSLCRYNRKFWTVYQTLLFLVLLVIGQVISVFIQNSINETSDSDPVAQHLKVTAHVFKFSPIIILLFCNFRWLLAVAMSKWPLKFGWCKSYLMGNLSVDENCNESNVYTEGHIYFTLVWVITSLFAVIMLSGLALIYGDIHRYNSIPLILNNVIFIFVELSITIFSMRMVKFEVVQTLVSPLAFNLFYLFYTNVYNIICNFYELIHLVRTQ